MSNSLGPGQNTGVGSLSLLEEIFPTQWSNPCLLHCRQNLYQLSHRGSQRILEWVAYPFSRWSSQPKNWTHVSCIASGFFTNWAIREAHTLAEEGRNSSSSGDIKDRPLGDVSGPFIPLQCFFLCNPWALHSHWEPHWEDEFTAWLLRKCTTEYRKKKYIKFYRAVFLWKN